MPDFIHPIEGIAQSQDSWRLFRIMSEFVDGFEILPTIAPSISIFGSARLPETSPYYQIATDTAYKIASKGFSIITGAGPSIMEAANKGAQLAHGKSCGLVIDLPFESKPNDYIDQKLCFYFQYFFVRKVMFVRYAQGFVFLPGGYGTLDELFETVTLIQTKKIQPVPIYLVGTAYWQGLMDWIRDKMLGEHCITKEELELITITDDLDLVANTLYTFYQDKIKLRENTI